MDISVIIPVYNGERYLAQAIESVLAQTLPPSEIIVIDDGSTDGSVAIAERFAEQVRIDQQENRGAASARNRGVDLAKGSLLAFLDADDLWTSDKLRLQVDALEKDPGLAMVLGKVTQFISPDVAGDARHHLRNELETMPAYLIGAMLIRRDAFITVGILDEGLQLGEYIEWFNRAVDLGLRHRVLDEVVLKRRIHTSNQGIYKRPHVKDYLSVLKSALDRRRGKHHTTGKG